MVAVVSFLFACVRVNGLFLCRLVLLVAVGLPCGVVCSGVGFGFGLWF